jgi:hypothetical protein
VTRLAIASMKRRVSAVLDWNMSGSRAGVPVRTVSARLPQSGQRRVERTKPA